jgi:hypothetical protein
MKKNKVYCDNCEYQWIREKKSNYIKGTLIIISCQHPNSKYYINIPHNFSFGWRDCLERNEKNNCKDYKKKNTRRNHYV